MLTTPQRFAIATTLVASFSGNTTGWAADFLFDRHTLTVPEGYAVELVAGPPLVERPIGANFDERGRLYVTESSGSNAPVEIQARERPHRIVRLEDLDGDGVFDSRQVFADGMMLPQGALWHAGSLYVAAPPEIWKLTDTNDDGVADRREVWLDPGTLTGCANDLHGPYLGPDGFLYWAKGAFATQTYERADGSEWTTRAAHLFRRHPDGGPVEAVMTGGMDNPVEVAFSPSGERFFTTTFLQRPSGGKRDGIIHAIYGGVYGKVHDVIDTHPQTGGLLAPMTHMGPAAACALLRPESTRLDPQAPNVLFASAFNLNKVTRHHLIADGATFTTNDQDFLVSDHRDFHPTDLIEDADGSLLVVDTGGWYKLCCPTSQLHKPDTLGAIYRVRRTDRSAPLDPRGLQWDWDTAPATAIAHRLNDHRPAVAERAMAHLAGLGPQAATALGQLLRGDAPAIGRTRAVWALTRIDSPVARALVRLALEDRDATVRGAAIHSVGLWRDRFALTALLAKLEVESPALRRAIAEALGRIGDATAIPGILKALRRPIDAVETHSLTYALMEIDHPEATRLGLASPYTRVRRATMLALDQAASHSLRAEELAVFLAAEDDALRDTALWILERRPSWGAALAPRFQERIGGIRSTDDPLFDQLRAVAAAPSIQELCLGLADRSTPSMALRARALQAMAPIPAPIPTRVQTALSQYLENGHPLFEPALELALTLMRRDPDASHLRDTLAVLALNTPASAPATLVNILDALPHDVLPLNVTPVSASFMTVLGALTTPGESNASLGVHDSAARLLAHAPLTEEQWALMLEALPSIPPDRIYSLLPAFRDARLEQSHALVEALRDHPKRERFSPPALRDAAQNLPEHMSAALQDLINTHLDDGADRRERLEARLARLDEGDIERGQTVFNSPQAACSLCHEIGYLGGDLGPDLTSIGQARDRRDLLEAILYPSESFVRSYEPYSIQTNDGGAYLGIPDGESAGTLRLKVGPNATIELPTATIVSRHIATISLMPSGLADTLSDRELSDLLAFLEATKWR